MITYGVKVLDEQPHTSEFIELLERLAVIGKEFRLFEGRVGEIVRDQPKPRCLAGY
jgi:hypothetical protein